MTQWGDYWLLDAVDTIGQTAPSARGDGEAARRIAEHHMFGAREVRLRMYADSSEHSGTG